MNPLRSIASAYVRLRHQHGFGVHSPFAYNLVCNALTPTRRYSYYGYRDIEDAALAPGARISRRQLEDARRLLRLAVSLGSKRLICTDANLALTLAVAKALAIECVDASERGFTKGDLVNLTGQSADVAADALAAGAAVLATDCDRETADTVRAFRGKGLLLSGTRVNLAVPNENMAFVEYTMRF